MRIVSQKYVWPGCKTDEKKWASQCIDCQRAKITRQNKAGANSIFTENEKLSQVHIDIVGPLPYNDGQKYLLTILDRFTRMGGRHTYSRY